MKEDGKTIGQSVQNVNNTQIREQAPGWVNIQTRKGCRNKGKLKRDPLQKVKGVVIHEDMTLRERMWSCKGKGTIR